MSCVIIFSAKLNSVSLHDKYHPVNVEPSLVGSSGFEPVNHCETSCEATGVPQLELNVIT